MELNNNSIITTDETVETGSIISDIITPQINYDDLEKIRKTIEKLDKSRHIDIAKIFKKNNIKLTENNNGIFINLNNIPSGIISEIKHYINFVKTQETMISIDESTKVNIEKNYFKDKFDDVTPVCV
jgi:fructose-1,6-bisphosphatase/sedoheptulose 1,7-bisphosphatase-like protein